ncbi:hypothetical protein CFIMG_007687RA00001 [Ceratocystis fimbriata CBS 114723]|uniref:Uncharacterized protein n=1 Tax=Ceratocystis fimbriata CBS 114723 TaxID=1035309 RepID=A0A2C5XBX7_9PEZI|nr:hypothetical protein CFIMG_007687RA00001 [Ceratocystis fimbriata CBS 114723]
MEENGPRCSTTISHRRSPLPPPVVSTSRPAGFDKLEFGGSGFSIEPLDNLALALAVALTAALAPSFAPAFAAANPKTQLRRSAAQDSGAFLRLFLRCLLF